MRGTRLPLRLVVVAVILSCLSPAELPGENRPLKVGLVMAKTGLATREEAPVLDAARLAVDLINTSGGIKGRTVELLVFDSASTPIGAKSAAQKAVSSGASCIIGAFRSSHSLAMVPVADRASIPMISPASTNPEVTKGSPYAFRVCFVDSFQGAVMAGFASRELKAKSAVVIFNCNEDYSMTLARVFVDRFRELGGSILWEGSYTGNATDFKEILARVRDLSPDVVYNPGYARDSGLFIGQAQAMGVKAVFLGADGWDQEIFPYAGGTIENAYSTTHWHKDVPFKANERFKEAYRKRFGAFRVDNIRVPLTYDAIMLFADAARRARSLDGAAIREALATTRGFHGATGDITMGPDRTPVGKEASIMRSQGGSWRFHKAFSPP